MAIQKWTSLYKTHRLQAINLDHWEWNGLLGNAVCFWCRVHSQNRATRNIIINRFVRYVCGADLERHMLNIQIYNTTSAEKYLTVWRRRWSRVSAEFIIFAHTSNCNTHTHRNPQYTLNKWEKVKGRSLLPRRPAYIPMLILPHRGDYLTCDCQCMCVCSYIICKGKTMMIIQLCWRKSDRLACGTWLDVRGAHFTVCTSNLHVLYPTHRDSVYWLLLYSHISIDMMVLVVEVEEAYTAPPSQLFVEAKNSTTDNAI